MSIVSSLPQIVAPWDDECFGPRYRAAARLKDGSLLWCVVFQSKERTVDFIARRLREELDPFTYQILVESYTTSSSVSELEVVEAFRSPYAWPNELLREIKGETVMGHTAFVAEMKDGRAFNYLVESACYEFIDLPPGYGFADIKTVRNGMTYSSERGLEPFTAERRTDTAFLRTRGYFNCYLCGLLSITHIF